ncbi:hypothetical protein ATS76_11975 [Pseudoalteromonas sp. 10-33]|nr:hypothetical protein ATS76_11975 [Pseudoalteromonas sp. 10-33]
MFSLSTSLFKCAGSVAGCLTVNECMDKINFGKIDCLDCNNHKSRLASAVNTLAVNTACDFSRNS